MQHCAGIDRSRQDLSFNRAAQPPAPRAKLEKHPFLDGHELVNQKILATTTQLHILDVVDHRLCAAAVAWQNGIAFLQYTYLLGEALR